MAKDLNRWVYGMARQGMGDASERCYRLERTGGTECYSDKNYMKTRMESCG